MKGEFFYALRLKILPFVEERPAQGERQKNSGKREFFLWKAKKFPTSLKKFGLENERELKNLNCSENKKILLLEGCQPISRFTQTKLKNDFRVKI